MLTNSKKVLSWFTQHLEIEASLQHLSQYHQKWSTSIQGTGQASFHLVLHQECHFHFLEQKEFIHLFKGDAIFLLRDLPFVITDLSQHNPPELNQLQRNLISPQDPQASCATHLACGFFKFRSKLSELFIDALPAYFVLRKDEDLLHECLSIFDLIRRETQNENASSSLLIERLTSILFFYLIRHIFEQSNNQQIPLLKLFHDPTFYPLILQIIAEPETDWSLEYMAQHCGISRASFSKRFTEVAGFSATKFVLYYRMQMAQKYLSEGLPISECAEKVGYQSIAAFTRAFQRVTQKNPSYFLPN